MVMFLPRKRSVFIFSRLIILFLINEDPGRIKHLGPDVARGKMCDAFPFWGGLKQGDCLLRH
jgi:hypothetical protein